MSRKSRYTLDVPTVDTLGNPLEDISARVHGHLRDRGIDEDAYVTGPHRVLRGQASIPTEHFVTYLDDSPENDSQMKEVAKYVAGVSNHPHGVVVKDSSQGSQVFKINNPIHKPGVASPITKPTTIHEILNGALPGYTGLPAFR